MWVDWWNDRSLQQNAVVHDRCITLTFCLKTTLHNNLFLKSYKTHCALVPNIRQLNHKVIEKPILPVRHWQTSVWDFAMKWYRAASSFVVTVIEWKQHQNFTRVQKCFIISRTHLAIFWGLCCPTVWKNNIQGLPLVAHAQLLLADVYLIWI